MVSVVASVPGIESLGPGGGLGFFLSVAFGFSPGAPGFLPQSNSIWLQAKW